jgi:sulfite reductase subunit B
MSYDLKKEFSVTTNTPTGKQIIIGMHPYDIIALQQADKVYLDDQKDDFYKKRRENTLIIGTDIQTISDRSFAGSMGTYTTNEGFDLMLTNLGSNYAITIGTKKGQSLLEKHAETTDATNEDIHQIEKTRESLPNKYKQQVKIDKDEWSAYLVNNFNNSLWEEKSDKCLECGSCVMVCPTCYCYDVKENVSLNLKNGERIRTWDACLLRDFTKIGSGEVFRNKVRDRYRHRFFRKGNYLSERYDFIACVGCGRCGTACLPDIADPCNVLNELSHFGKSDDTGKYVLKQDTQVTEKGTIHIPRQATIKRVESLTDTEMLFELQLDDKKPLDYKPGQFVEVSIFGIGEAPISISSAPTDKPSFELAVRKVGNVTSKLFTMKPGDKLGIRGPFGNGFDIKSLENKDILFVSGGIGIIPIRSLIEYVLDPRHRHKFNYIKILYGAKQPCQILFQDKIAQWEKCNDVTCKLTVDSCVGDECWTGSVGLITSLFPKIQMDRIDPKNTMAVVCGPPIMYKFVLKCLQTLGVPDENILVSLERRMKCGVGKCGHCQINGVYVCKEGPVFKYNEVKNFPEAFE